MTTYEKLTYEKSSQRAAELANAINNASDWKAVQDEMLELCKMAGLKDEWEKAIYPEEPEDYSEEWLKVLAKAAAKFDVVIYDI